MDSFEDIFPIEYVKKSLGKCCRNCWFNLAFFGLVIVFIHKDETAIFPVKKYKFSKELCHWEFHSFPNSNSGVTQKVR